MFPPETLILIVDDMTPMRTLVKGQVRNLGYRNLIEADNGRKAFDMLLNQHKIGKPVGVILSDWNMPVMTGIEFLKKVRSTDPFKSLPFIMITAESEKAQILEAIKNGVSNYVMKPFTPKMFQDKFKAVWEKLHGPSTPAPKK